MNQRILSYFITKRLWLIGVFSFAAIGGFLFYLFATAQIEAQSPSGFLPEPEIADSNSFDVIQTVPIGQLQTTDAKEIVVAFNQPLIPLGKVDSSDLEPFKIEPKLNGKFRWYGSSVAAFLPSEPLEPGRSYSILVPAGLKDIEGRSLKQARSFSFHTKPLTVLYTEPSKESMIEYDQSIFIEFNLPVSKDNIKPFIELTANNNRINFSIDVASNREYSSNDESIQQGIEVRPTVSLPRNSKIKLVLKKGLPLTNGKPGLIADETITLNTPGPVTVSLPYSEPKELINHGNDYFQDRHSIALEFNNSVIPNSIFDYLQLFDDKNQPIKMSAPDDYYPTTYVSSYSWPVQPGRSYRIVVKQGLTDIYGNKLQQTKEFKFKMPPLRPFLEATEGWGAGEALFSTKLLYNYGNVPEVRVEVAPFTVANLANLIESETTSATKMLKFQKTKIAGAKDSNTIEYKLFDVSKYLKSVTPTGAAERKIGWLAYRFEADTVNWQGKPSKASYTGFFQSTDLGLTVRESPYSAHIWVQSLSSGVPIQDVVIQQYNDKSVTGRCSTDITGYCQIKKSKQSISYHTFFVATDQRNGYGADSAFVTPGQNSVYNGVRWADSKAGSAELRGMILFDRKLYRPGDTVQFKAVVSVLTKGELTPYRMGDLQIVANDSRGRQIYSKVLKPTSQGGIFDSFVLPVDSPLGHYNFRVTANNFSGRDVSRSDMGGIYDGIQVEEFRALTFTVNTTGAEDQVQAASTPIRIEGRYLFGAPMSAAIAKITVFERAESVNLDSFPEFETNFIDNSVDRVFQQSQGKLDANGSINLLLSSASFSNTKINYIEASDYDQLKNSNKNSNVISIPEKLNQTIELKPHRKIRIEAKILDASNRSVTNNSHFTMFAASVFPALRPTKYVFEQGKPAIIEILFANTLGLAALGSAELFIFRTEYQLIETKAAGNSLTRQYSQLRILEKTDRISGSTVSNYSFTPKRAGTYEILARTKDGAYATTVVYVAGKDAGWWNNAYDDSVELVTDKKIYKPNDTAKILIKSPYQKARAIVTVEREDILEKQVVELNSSAQSIDIKLKPEYIPGVQVSVMIFRPRVKVERSATDQVDLGKPIVKMGTVYVDLATETKRLPLQITSSCHNCGPRQEVEVTIQTVAGAEVALDVADRAILDLVGYRFGDPIQKFYDSRPYGIRVMDIRDVLIDQFLRAGKGDPGGGGDDAEAASGGFGVDGEDGMRKDFRYTAEWKPVLVADSSGLIKVKFRLPDNLTTFRIMALAAKDGLFGKAEREFVVQKSVVTMPVLPNFIRPGDSVWAGALVVNQTGSKSDFNFELETNFPFCYSQPNWLGFGESVATKQTKKVSLNAGESKEILFLCKLPKDLSFLQDNRKEKLDPLKPSFRLEIGSVQFKLKTTAANQKDDGVIKTVPIRQEVIREAFTISGSTTDRQNEQLLIPNPKENPGELSLQLSPTVLLGLKGGFDYYSMYQYLCLEQRISALLLYRMAGEFAPKSTGGIYDVAKLDELTYGALSLFQNLDGGFRAWKERESTSDPYLTAYVLEALLLDKKKMSTEQKSKTDAIVDRALNYLANYMQRPTRDTEFFQVETLNYVHYVLSLYGKGKAELVKFLLNNWQKLSLRGRGYLLLSADVNQIDTGNTGNELIQDFQNRLSFSTRKIELRETLPFSASRIYYSTGSTASVWARYLIQKRLQPDLISKIVIGLLQRNLFLSSTHDEAAIAIAMRSYHDHYEKGYATSATVLLDERELLKSNFDLKQPFVGANFDTEALIKKYDFSNLEVPKKISFLNSSKSGRVYYNATLDYSIDFSKVESKDEGISISRQIFDDQMKPLTDLRLKRGEVYVVRLRAITRRPISDFVLRDPISSVSEIVNTSFQTEGVSLSSLEESSNKKFWFESRPIIEKRYDAYVLTNSYLSAGIHEYLYLIRPISAGNSSLPPTTAQAMYEPEIFGRSAGQLVEALK